jgi:hypothetical protein
MIRLANCLGRLSPRLLAVLLVCLAPTLLRAETVMFRNECKGAVIVQTMTLVKGVLRRDQPSLLRYGECTPKLKLDADMVITIYDGKTNRMLFRSSLKASTKPLYYSIIWNQRLMQVQVITAKPPPAMTTSTSP